MPSEEFCFKEEQRNKVVARGRCKTKEEFIFVRVFFFFFLFFFFFSTFRVFESVLEIHLKILEESRT